MQPRLVLPVLTLAALAAPSARAGFVANLQPISYCNDDGTECADTQLDDVLFAEIWAQADLTFHVLPVIQFDLSANAVIADFNTALGLHKDIVTFALGGPSAFTLYLGVARDNTESSSTIGLSFMNLPFGIIDGGETSPDLFLRTFNAAHQIGHMLNLSHNGVGNALPLDEGLMSPGFPQDPSDPSTYKLFPVNVQQIQQSALIARVEGVPEPATLVLMGLGLAILGHARHKSAARH